MLLDVCQLQEFSGGQGAELMTCETPEHGEVDAAQVELLHSPLGPKVSVLFSPLGRIWENRRGREQDKPHLQNLTHLCKVEDTRLSGA